MNRTVKTVLHLLSILCFGILLSAGTKTVYAEGCGALKEMFVTPPVPSFLYDGTKFSPETFSMTEREISENDSLKTRLLYWESQDGKLRLEQTVREYKEYPVYEYSLRLVNISDQPTGLIEDFQSVDLELPNTFTPDVRWGRGTPPDERYNFVTLRTIKGAMSQSDDFSAQQVKLSPNNGYLYKTDCGRSSTYVFPFIEVELNPALTPDRRFLFALGWTGSWKAEIDNSWNTFQFKAGMVKTHFRLMPGESVLQPSVMILYAEMPHSQYQTMLHRFMRDFKSPRDGQGNLFPPVKAFSTAGGNKPPELMLKILDYVTKNRLPFDTMWVDAGWYGAPHEDELLKSCGVHWAEYAGDWVFNTTIHPSGTLLPVVDEVHRHGMKQMLWFEPERVEILAPISKEHPEYLHDNLLDLGNPEAFRWIEETIFGLLDRNKIDIYRQDFNMHPDVPWEKMDAESPDRAGYAEAAHITGLYKFLDDMRGRFPNMLQDNCASGGRRLDLEMISRSHVYCRSDFLLGKRPGDTAYIVAQNATRNTLPFMPFQGGSCGNANFFDDYAIMSDVSAGYVLSVPKFGKGIIQRDFTEKETAWFQHVFSAASRMSDMYMGDFYPLGEDTSYENNVWCAWQLDVPEKNEGFAIAFRRADAPEASQTYILSNIDKTAEYDVEYYDGTTEVLSGEKVKHWKLNLDPRSFKLMFYKKR